MGNIVKYITISIWSQNVHPIHNNTLLHRHCYTKKSRATINALFVNSTLFLPTLAGCHNFTSLNLLLPYFPPLRPMIIKNDIVAASWVLNERVVCVCVFCMSACLCVCLRNNFSLFCVTAGSWGLQVGWAIWLAGAGGGGLTLIALNLALGFLGVTERDRSQA